MGTDIEGEPVCTLSFMDDRVEKKTQNCNGIKYLFRKLKEEFEKEPININ